MLDPGYTGHRPRVQLFHGDADTTINYTNFTEAIKEWTNVLGLTRARRRRPWACSSGTIRPRASNGRMRAATWSSTDSRRSAAITGRRMRCSRPIVVPFLGLDKTGAIDPEIQQCGNGGTGAVRAPTAGRRWRTWWERGDSAAERAATRKRRRGGARTRAAGAAPETGSARWKRDGQGGRWRSGWHWRRGRMPARAEAPGRIRRDDGDGGWRGQPPRARIRWMRHRGKQRRRWCAGAQRSRHKGGGGDVCSACWPSQSATAGGSGACDLRKRRRSGGGATGGRVDSSGWSCAVSGTGSGDHLEMGVLALGLALIARKRRRRVGKRSRPTG